MPSATSTVGPIPVPTPAGDTDATIADATEDSLLDYVAFWLKYALDSYAKTQTAPPVVDIAPIANRYTNAPSDVYLKRALPALFVYWNDKSTCEQFTMTRWMRRRDFTIQWCFESVKTIEGVKRYSGLISTADAAIHRAFVRLAHPAYAYGSFSAGTDIRDMFSLRGVEYLGGQEGFLKELPQSSLRKQATAAGRRSENAAEGGIQSGYPCLLGTIRAWEDIGEDTMLDAGVTAPGDAGDVLHDGTFAIKHLGVDILDRYLPQPDGTEPGSGFPQT